ncbi:uncharacterized protein LOC102803831 [Saccoglossus kowalevskii]|uniref:Uncharacterized protein LOC102803831 n=1 Tax=Saccoglossus kowalevskii TaxID=10224 RepID=A0ABM0LY13_SACKO|nr:PREDICTED: uncharacterized protein LOC102803831 [Saccoglossus kowalevskii]
MFLIHCEAAVTNYVIKQQKYHWDLATPDDLLAALDSYILLCNKVCQMRRIPRTLQHQCRHALRVMLGKKYVDAIEKFTLSRQLKNFLLFTDPQQVDFSEAVED